MVLQRDRPMHFWGWADPDEKVTLTLDGQSAQSTADKLGKWSLYLPAHAAGGPFTIDVKGSNDLKIEDVMIGDVWFASGQSNMEMPLSGWPGASLLNSDDEIKAADFPDIRLFTVKERLRYSLRKIAKVPGLNARRKQ